MDKKELRAGAGAAVICFPKDFFAAFPGGAVSWNEPRVRALILDNGQRVCLVSLELASIAGDHIPGLQALVEEATGIPADHLGIMAARTPSAPALPPRKLRLWGRRSIPCRLSGSGGLDGASIT